MTIQRAPAYGSSIGEKLSADQCNTIDMKEPDMTTTIDDLTKAISESFDTATASHGIRVERTDERLETLYMGPFKDGLVAPIRDIEHAARPLADDISTWVAELAQRGVRRIVVSDGPRAWVADDRGPPGVTWGLRCESHT